MANLWGNGKKSNTNKANGYKNGQNLKKKGEKTVPVLDRDFNQPEAVVELPVAEIQRPAVLPHTLADHEATAVENNTTIDLLRDGRVIKLIDALMLGRINEIVPVIDLTVKSGGHYPDIERRG